MKSLFWVFVILIYQGAVIVGSSYFCRTGPMFVAVCGFFGCIFPLLLVAFLHWYQQRKTIEDLKDMMKHLNNYENDNTEIHT